MKTEKIEIWVDNSNEIPKNIEMGLECIFCDVEYTKSRSNIFKYKVTLEIEMPEREGKFTEIELIKFWSSNCRCKEALDKLFNGDFKE